MAVAAPGTTTDTTASIAHVGAEAAARTTVASALGGSGAVVPRLALPPEGHGAAKLLTPVRAILRKKTRKIRKTKREPVKVQCEYQCQVSATMVGEECHISGGI